MQNYQEYLNSEGWKAKRNMILNMWGNRCALCNEGGELHLHHRAYERKGNEDPYDLIPLCKKHHEIFHEKNKPETDGYFLPVDFDNVNNILIIDLLSTGDIIKDNLRIRRTFGILISYGSQDAFIIFYDGDDFVGAGQTFVNPELLARIKLLGGCTYNNFSLTAGEKDEH